MNIVSLIFALIILWVIAKWILRKTPEKYRNFFIVLILLAAVLFPFILESVAIFVPYATFVAAAALGLFFILYILGQKKFAHYFEGNELQYWLIIGVILVGALSLSQLVGDRLLEEDVFTGNAVSEAAPAISGQSFLDTSFVFIIALAIFSTLMIFMRG